MGSQSPRICGAREALRALYVTSSGVPKKKHVETEFLIGVDELLIPYIQSVSRSAKSKFHCGILCEIGSNSLDIPLAGASTFSPRTSTGKVGM